jgi:Polyketide cyclase / dehydrase and lipid transport
MPDTYRRHTLIEAPIDDVWSIVSDPGTHPEWWPELRAVRAPVEGGKEGEYTRTMRRMGFLDFVDSIWVAEPMEQVKQVNFRCTVTGTFTRFSLTPAQDDTFVELEAGIVPIGLQGRILKVAQPLYFSRWLADLLDALPAVVTRKTEAKEA